MGRANGGCKACTHTHTEVAKTWLIRRLFSQSQSINPLYLPTIPAHTPSDPTRRKTIDRKTDYVLSYSHRDPTTANLYKRLAVAGISEIGHTLDAFTKRTALYCSVEVKPASGDHTEAELQMSLAIAAAILKKQSLAHDAQILLEPTSIVEPSLTVIGHEHSLYYAYPRDDGIHVLGPDLDRFERLSTESMRDVFRLLRTYGNILEFGADEGTTGYFGRFLGPVLETLAGNPHAQQITQFTSYLVIHFVAYQVLQENSHRTSLWRR
jgi:hypothetical protein